MTSLTEAGALHVSIREGDTYAVPRAAIEVVDLHAEPLLLRLGGAHGLHHVAIDTSDPAAREAWLRNLTT